MCADCGSFNIGRDSWAVWNHEREEWEIAAVYDHMQCLDCDSDRINEVQYPVTESLGDEETQ